MIDIADTFNLKSISDIPELKEIFESKNFSSLRIDDMTEVLRELNAFWVYEPNWNDLQRMTSYSKWPEEVAAAMYHDYRDNKITLDTKCLCAVDTEFIENIIHFQKVKNGTQDKLKDIL